ncbi:MAG: hypothetical protein J6S24_01560 [Lentisphaeria bacterium]|nr:hypothetical protein [Lentisphaeria bacterium]
MSAEKSQKIMTGTFWYWNATPTRAGIRRQLAEIASAGYSCVYIHPMPDSFHRQTFFCGMKCRYLGEKFFSLVKYALEESKKLGLKFMLYDEGGWPSGGVLDTLVEKYPECRAKTVRLEEDGSIVETWTNYPDQFRAEPVRRFIEMTHELYKRELGDEFGKSIKGIFTDEPFLKLHVAYPLSVVNDEIVGMLKSMYGKDFYKDILPHIGLFKATTPEAETARALYCDVCSRLFAKHYSEQLAKWCEENNLDLEGHFSGEDEYLPFGVTGNLLRVLTPFHVPGVDVIWRQIYPGQAYEFFPRFATSAAIRAKRSQTLCEAFNVFTYAITPKVMNYVANALMVQGINRILPMPFMYKDTGKHKICCSTDISPRTPAFDAMKDLNAFWNRAADFDAGALDPKVWFFTQAPMRGREYENPERTEIQFAYNREMISYADMLDFAGVFWRFADEDDKDSKTLPELLIVPRPELLLEKQKEAVEFWKSKGVKIVSSPAEADLKKYAALDVADDNKCRILPCVRPEGRAVMVFNSSDEDTVFKFRSGDGYDLLHSGVIDEVYPLRKDGAVYSMEMPAYSLRILIEKPFAANNKEFESSPVELKWQVKAVEALRFSLEDKSRYEKRKVDVPLPASGNYCELDKDFSGRLLLESTLVSDCDCEAYLKFDSVDFYASLRVNSVDCGSAAYAPYIYRIKLKKGVNKLVLKVSGSAGNEFRRCFREELEPAGYFNNYAKRFSLYKIDDDKCGVSQRVFLIKERKNK